MASKGHRIVFPEAGRAAVEEFDVPSAGPNELLIRTTHSLVSAGTEMTTLTSAIGSPKYPYYPGYSNVGVVEAAGKNVSGDHPAGTPVVSMGRHTSHFILDLSLERRVVGVGGVEYRGPEYVQKLPAGVSQRDATFAVLGSVAIHGLRKAEPRLGNSAAVFGQGVVGQLTVMLLKAAGCRPVIAADLVASRLEKSKISGADFLVDGSKEDSVEDVLRLTNRAGAELVFDATRTPKTLPLMMKAAAQAGKVLIVGSLPGTVEIDAFTELQLRELTIIGVFQPASPLQAHPYNPFTQSRNRLTFLNLLADGTLAVNHLITHTPKWSEGPAIFDMIHEGPASWMGIVFDWT